MLADKAFTADARTVMDAAQAIAEQRQHDAIEPEHVLLALMTYDLGLGHAALCRLDRQPDELRTLAERAVSGVSKGHPASRPVRTSPGLRKLVELAAVEACTAGQEAIHSEHLLLALVHPRQGGVSSVLQVRGVTYERVRQLLTEAHLQPRRVCEPVAALPQPCVLAKTAGEAAMQESA
jgi:ATP-dependent Clp protease ATP-binding subunit ClpB